jgi:2-aminoadipate transaminase
MRLNFSGVREDEIREGVRRIGKAVAEQVELYGALTGEHQLAEDSPDMPAAEPAQDGGDVLPFRKLGEGAAGRSPC